MSDYEYAITSGSGGNGNFIVEPNTSATNITTQFLNTSNSNANTGYLTLVVWGSIA